MTRTKYSSKRNLACPLAEERAVTRSSDLITFVGQSATDKHAYAHQPLPNPPLSASRPDVPVPVPGPTDNAATGPPARHLPLPKVPSENQGARGAGPGGASRKAKPTGFFRAASVRHAPAAAGLVGQSVVSP